MCRRLAIALAVAHRRQRRFEMAREARGIEERARVAVARKRLLQRAERIAVASELERQGFVFGERIRDQLGQSRCMQQARADTAGKGRSAAGQDREPRPQRIARGRVRPVGKRVEEEIRRAMTRQMFGWFHPWCKHQPVRCDTAGGRLAAQIVRSSLVVLEQPEDAIPNLIEQPHPQREKFRRQLVAVVETAEDECSVGQAEIGARGRHIGDRPAPIIALIGVGQGDDLFRVEGAVVVRDQQYVMSCCWRRVLLIPDDHRAFYTEKIVTLPDAYQCNDRRRTIADVTPSRADLGLPDGAFVFCCFNNSNKLTPELFALWMRLLDQVKDSVLWLLEDNQAATHNLRREAAARGVASDRLVFAPRLEAGEHLARHRSADLFLDTLPYGAHTTASDALWTGLPVLTCRGSTFAGRVGASLLHAAGLPELITDSLAEYEALALKLARDRDTLRALKQTLARRPRHVRALQFRALHAPFRSGADGDARPPARWQGAGTFRGGCGSVVNTAAIEIARRAHQSGNRPKRCGGAGKSCVSIRRISTLSICSATYTQSGELEDAQRLIGGALKVNPRSPDAAYNRGCILQTLTRHSEALGSFDQALASHPTFLDAFINRGISLLALKRPKEALVSFDRALKLKPDDAQAWNSHATALLHLGEPDQALASLDRALALNAGYAEAWSNRGVALHRLKRPADALASFAKSLTINPNGFTALNNRGSTLLDLHRYPDATQDFDRALALLPDYIDACINRHRADGAEGLRPRARQLYATLKTRPDSTEALYNRANTLMIMKRFEDAAADCERLITLDPNTNMHAAFSRSSGFNVAIGADSTRIGSRSCQACAPANLSFRRLQPPLFSIARPNN